MGNPEGWLQENSISRYGRGRGAESREPLLGRRFPSATVVTYRTAQLAEWLCERMDGSCSYY